MLASFRAGSSLAQGLTVEHRSKAAYAAAESILHGALSLLTCSQSHSFQPCCCLASLCTWPGLCNGGPAAQLL